MLRIIVTIIISFLAIPATSQYLRDVNSLDSISRQIESPLHIKEQIWRLCQEEPGFDESMYKLWQFNISYSPYSFYYYRVPNNTDHISHFGIYIGTKDNGLIIDRYKQLIDFVSKTYQQKNASQAISIIWHYVQLWKFTTKGPIISHQDLFDFHRIRRDSPMEFAFGALPEPSYHDQRCHKLDLNLPIKQREKSSKVIRQWQQYVYGLELPYTNYSLFKKPELVYCLCLLESNNDGKYTYTLMEDSDRLHMFELEDIICRIDKQVLWSECIYCDIIDRIIDQKQLSDDEKYSLIKQITSIIEAIESSLCF